jgi:hypothetical protein
MRFRQEMNAFEKRVGTQDPVTFASGCNDRSVIANSQAQSGVASPFALLGKRTSYSGDQFTFRVHPDPSYSCDVCSI